MNEIDAIYQNALKDIMENGIDSEDKRLFHKDQPVNKSATRALPGLSIKYDLSKGFTLISLRKLPIKLFVAESIWFLLGDSTSEPFLSKYTKIWE